MSGISLVFNKSLPYTFTGEWINVEWTLHIRQDRSTPKEEGRYWEHTGYARHTRGNLPKKELSSGVGGTLLDKLPPLGKCSKNPSVPASIVRGFEINFGEFSEGSFNALAHFTMGDLWVHLPTLCWVFSSFWPKMAWPPCPTFPLHLISPWATFFFVSLDEKSPQRQTFCWCERSKTKKRQKH